MKGKMSYSRRNVTKARERCTPLFSRKAPLKLPIPLAHPHHRYLPPGPVCRVVSKLAVAQNLMAASFLPEAREIVWTLILFISDRLSADLVALLALVTLLLFKFIT